MFPVVLAIIGAAVGSFLTVAVERFERGETFVTNRSICDACKKQLRWWELLPIVSFLGLKGKCARCKAAIPFFSFWFEVITAIVFCVFTLNNTGSVGSPLFYAELVVISSLLLLFFYDIRYQVFPGLYLIISAILVALFVVLQTVFVPTDVSLFEHILGGLVGMLLLGLLAVPSGGRWMGYGDVLLAGILGLWVGYPLVYVCLILAFYLGAIVGVGVLVGRKTAKDHRIAFGPFLILGALITNIWGISLFRAIMHLWGA